ncbi:MAG: repressor LexA [Chloroflexi bacterium]|nr:repressor LexA [Chloroflexota bacterium]
MMKRPLSKRQQEMLAYIKNFMQTNNYPPTVRDIQNGCQISSTSVVDYNLQILQREGHLARKRDVSRGLELLGEAASHSLRNLVNVPILGNIAAGEPLALQGTGPWNNEDFDNVDIPPFLTKNKENVFGLRVKGESMIDALVGDGDLVLLEPITKPNNGDMVAAWLEDREEATLKHFYLEGNKVRLVPANSMMQPITVSASNVAVKGRVVGVMRTM